MISIGSLSQKPSNGFINNVSSYSKSQCSIAYSLRIVEENYTGPLVSVRRVSDSTTENFYGNSTGRLGLNHPLGQSLTEWLNGSIGYVVTWYDQSGNSRNISSDSEATQPVITEENGVTFSSGTNTFLRTTNAPLTAGLDTYTYVVDFTPSSLAGSVICEQNFTNGSSGRRAGVVIFTDQTMGFQGISNNVYPLTYNKDIDIKLVMMVNNNLNPGNIVWMYNGSLYTSTTGNPGALNVADDYFTIGRLSYIDSERFDGHIREIIVFNNTLSVSEASIYFMDHAQLVKSIPVKPVLQLNNQTKSNISIPTDWVTALDMQMMQHLANNSSIGPGEPFNTSSHNSSVKFINPDINVISTSAIHSIPYINYIGPSASATLYNPLTFNINTNGGLTAVIYFAFRGPAVNYEKIVDFGASTSSKDDNISILRNLTNSATYFEINNGGTIAGNVFTANGTCPDNEFAVWTFRYTNFNKLYEIFKNGELLATNTGTLSVTNKIALANSRLARGTNGGGQAYLSLSGAYTYDRVLSHSEISAVSNHILYSCSPSTTYPVSQTIPKQIENQVHNGIITNIGRLDGPAKFYDGTINSFTDIQDVPCLPITFSMSFNMPDVTTSYSLFSICDKTRTGLGVNCNIINGNLSVQAALPTEWTTSNNYPVSINTWYHICCRLSSSGSFVGIHINGVSFVTLVDSSMVTLTNRIILGGNGNGTTGYLGYIKDFRLFNYILLQSEIDDVYTNTSSIPKLLSSSNRKSLVNNVNWYTEMTINNITGTAPVSSGTVPNIAYRLLNGATSRNQVSQQVRVQDFLNFILTLQFSISSSSTNSFFIYFGRNTELSTSNSYNLSFDTIENRIAFEYNGSIVVTTPINYWELDVYNTLVVEYQRNTTKGTWKIYLNDSLIITYGNDDSWLSSSGNYWGFGGLTTSNMSLWVRNVDLAYTPRETKLSEILTTIKGIKIPIFGMTGNTSSINGNSPYNGTYIASASSSLNPYIPYLAFQGLYLNAENSGWQSENRYDNSTGIYTGAVTTTSSSIVYSGEWIQLQIPNSIYLKEISIYPGTILERSPDNFVISGSNDGTSWTTLHIETGFSWTFKENTFIVNQGVNSSFTYFRLICLSLLPGSSGIANLVNISLFPSLSLGSNISPNFGLINGLTWKYYSGPSGNLQEAPNDNLYYSRETYRDIGTFTNGSSVTTITNGKYISLNNYSMEIFGYFKAMVSGTYIFYLGADDGASLWINNQKTGNALVGFTSANANLNTFFGLSESPHSIELLAGVYHPFRIQYSVRNTLAARLSLAFTPPGGSKTYDGTGYFFSSNGLNQAYPAENAKIIKDITGSNEDGVYYINCNGISTPIYCLMNDSYDGGGWMMLMKSTNTTTLQYSSSQWTTTSTLNATDTTRNNADAKYDSYNYQTIKDVMVIWPDIDPDSAVNIYNRKGGSFYVKDGWIWLLKNWSYISGIRITPLVGFTTPRIVGNSGSVYLGLGIGDPRNYNGYSSTVFSSQTVGSIVHYIAASDAGGVRWGFLWNDQVGTYSTSDAISGIGLSDRSAGDWNNGNGGAVGGINRNARMELYGR